MLNKLKKVKEELQRSSKIYDNAFKSTALIAAQELSNKNYNLDHENSLQDIIISDYTKECFVKKFGTLKNAKAVYKKIYGQQKYGRSWSEFIAIAKKLNNSQIQKSSVEERITNIENFLVSLGYQP